MIVFLKKFVKKKNKFQNNKNKNKKMI
jgi:hypothetical protein